MTNGSFKKSLKAPGSDPVMRKIRFVDLWVNRPPAYLIARLGQKLRLNPNQLTWVSFLLGMAGALLFASGTYPAVIVAGILVQLSSVVDGADGMLARLQGSQSRYGGHLDLFFDRMLDFSVFLGIALGLWRQSGDHRLLIAGLAAAGLYMLQVNLFYLTRSYLQTPEEGTTGEARAVLLLLVMIFALFNRLDIFIILLLAGCLLIILIRWGYFLFLGRRDRSAGS